MIIIYFVHISLTFVYRELDFDIIIIYFILHVIAISKQLSCILGISMQLYSFKYTNLIISTILFTFAKILYTSKKIRCIIHGVININLIISIIDFN